jgi:hypothetical protein
MSNEKFAENVSKSAENVEKTRQTIAASAMNEHALEAAANAEDIIRHLGEQWGDRGFTPEQCVFALALVTINYRESVPAQYGGKEMFDRVAAEARKYYDANR